MAMTFEEIHAEIEQLGTNTKAIHDEMQTNYKNLTKSVEENVVDKTKIETLKEDLVSRSEKLEGLTTKLQTQIDDLEVSLKRPSKIITKEDKVEFEEAKSHMLACMLNKGQNTNYDIVKNLDVSVDDYSAYCEDFKTFLRKDSRQLSPEQYKRLSVGVDPDGGYTVTPFMSNRIVQKIFEMDPIRQLANVQGISTDALELMVDWNEAGVGWENETESSSETDTPDFKKKRIPVHVMYAKPRATQQLLEDSAINIEQYIANKVAEKMGRYESAAFVTGDGVGKPRGFLTYDTGTDYGQIEQIDMGAAAVLTADGFIKIKYSLVEDYLNRGTWLMNRTTVRDAMLLKDGNGNYIWKPSIAVDAPSTILSLAVRMATSMPAVAANALSIVLADFNEAYTIVDRLGVTVQRDPYTVKPFVEFYTRKRVGGDVVNFQAMKIGKISE